MEFEHLYKKNLFFPHRYIAPERLEKFLHENLGDYSTLLGTSYLGKNIYKVHFGTGTVKVLAWSQMHGNESNATHAMLDLLETFKGCPELQNELFEQIQLDFVFMLNPDGSEKWTRRNALDIDMNRDYIKESSKEFPLLKHLAMHGNYDYALNLHEQRTLFSTDGVHPATLSFLSPSENVDREVTETRKKSMAVIADVASRMQKLIPDQIARYSDEFYPTSTGDNFTKMGLPTILYEGGHFPDDYQRNGTRKYYTIALYYGLRAIGRLKNSTDGWTEYFEIPENREDHYDVIYRNVKLNTDFRCVLDIAVQYKEIIREGDDDISFVPIVVEVGDCGRKKGWEEIDCSGRLFKCSRKYPKIDAEVDFEIV